MPRLSGIARMAPRPSAQQVYEALHGEIVQGVLRPGDALPETRVGERFGLSRTPVREVFWRLEEAGFLRVVPQVGTFVAPISIPAVFDSQFVRETLEVRAVADAATRAAPDAVAALRRLIGEQEAALAIRDFPAFFAGDEAMHRALMELAGHPSVWGVIASAKAQLDRVRYLSLAEGEWPGMILDQHRALIDRVAAGDGSGAAAVMTTHLRTAFAAIDRIAEAHPAFFEGRDGTAG